MELFWKYLGDLLNVVGFFGLIITILNWFYTHKIKFYVVINKLFSINKTVRFDLVILSTNKSNKINEILENFRLKTSHSLKMISKSKNKIDFSYEDLRVSIEYNSRSFDEFDTIVSIESPKATYNESLKRIKSIGKIISLLEKEELLTNVNFQFKTYFNKNNPFVGQTLSNVKIGEIKRFMMILSFSDEGKFSDIDNDIQINLNEISYVDNEYVNIVEVADFVLAL
ncbi:hypothetical protein [Aerococcus urinaeequi]|uniref:hypothetical protein n=1 Tax=Aerococcus urinaeequi TaxID=51665 RepID=UPI003D6BEC0D